MDDRIQYILQKIEKHYKEPLCLGQLAKEVNLSVSRLEHLFKKEVGLSYKGYLKVRRLQEALFLLKENNHMTLKEIAYTIGYSDYTNFVHAFKERFRKAPRNYRKEEL